MNNKQNNQDNQSLNHSFTQSYMTCMSCHDHVHDHTEPGVFPYPTDEQLSEICEVYRIVTGRELNSITARLIEGFFEQVEPALIVQALERTGRYARRPCAEYAAAILRNWIKAGIRTMAELTTSDDQRRQAKQMEQSMQTGWWNRQNYQQHHYTEADFSGDFYYDPLKDYGQ